MIDKLLMLSTEKEITSVGSVSDTLDLGMAGYGAGTPIPIKCIVNEAFTSGGAGTLAVTIASSLTEGGTYTTHFSLAAQALSALTLGATLIDSVLPSNVSRWLKVTYTVATAAMTAGKVSTYLDPK